MTSRAEVAPFVDWGGRAWEEQVAAGIDWLGSVDGLRVLEIGTRYGGMATWFATRGAEVTALDVSEKTFPEARARAQSFGVGDRVRFDTYSGRPADLPTGFDVVFTKSTLVLMGGMDEVAPSIAASLVPGGRLLAVENAHGPIVLRVARAARPWTWLRRKIDYFKPEAVEAIRSHLAVELERWTSFPPTVLIGARRREPSPA